MLDPIACVGMELSTPLVSLEALLDLANLLSGQGARESSSTALAAAEEDQGEENDGNAARRLAPNEHGIRFSEDARDEPTATRGSDQCVSDIACGSGWQDQEGEPR